MRPRGARRATCSTGAVLGEVDFFAAKHGVDARAQAGFFGELQKKRERLVGDAVLRVIEVEAAGFDCEERRTLGIAREKIPEMQAADLAVVAVERFPRGGLGDGDDRSFVHYNHHEASSARGGDGFLETSGESVDIHTDFVEATAARTAGRGRYNKCAWRRSSTVASAAVTKTRRRICDDYTTGSPSISSDSGG